MKPDRESASLLAEVLADEPDFATEHRDFTVGDHERGGPEGVPEPESPKGYGGADIHHSRRSRPEHKAVIMALQEPHTAPPTPPPAPTTPSAPAAPLTSAAPPTPTSPPVPASPLASATSQSETEPLPEPEPDFALEHRNLTVGGTDAYRTRRH